MTAEVPNLVILLLLGFALLNALLAGYLLVRRSVVTHFGHVADRRRRAIEPLVVAWITAKSEAAGAPAEVALRKRRRAADLDAVTAAFAHALGYLRGTRRDAALRFLDELGVMNRLHGRLQSRFASRRAKACERTGEIAHPDSVALLARLLDDKNQEVRVEAARALGRTRLPSAAQPLARLLHTGQVSRGTTFHALVELGPSAVTVFRNALVDDDPDVRAVACLGLGRSAPDDDFVLDAGADLMHRAQSDHYAEVREAAIIGLAEFDEQRAAPILEHALTDQDARVRRAAARALKTLSRPKSLAPLTRALHDLDRETVLRAALALHLLDVRDGPAAALPDHWALRNVRAELGLTVFE